MSDFSTFAKLTPDEKLVFDVLAASPVTQLQIATKLRWLGSHEIYENPKRKESTLRKIRQLIHNVREKGFPIMSSDSGYWLATTKQEKLDYLNMATAKENVRAANAKNYLSGLRREWGLTDSDLQGTLFQ
jgi:hypothetical protein